MNNHRYSLSGAFASLAVVALVGTSSPGNAIPIVPDGYGTSVPVQPPGFSPGDMRGASAVPPSVEAPEVPPGQRQCFIWQPHWNEALDGPQPLCPIEPDR